MIPGHARRGAAALALALALTSGLAACGPAADAAKDDAQLAQEAVDEAIAEFRTLGEGDDVDQLAPEAVSTLETYGIDAQEFFEHMLAYTSYEVADVEVDDDEATVTLTVSTPNYEDALERAYGRLETWVSSDEAGKLYADSGSDALYQELFKLLYEEVDEAGATQEQQVELSLRQDEGTGWALDPASEDRLATALCGGIEFEDLEGPELGKTFMF